ncbi:MAG: M24 family metallopeptidase, partial [Candidatus Omnitrophota bacterium]
NKDKAGNLSLSYLGARDASEKFTFRQNGKVDNAGMLSLTYLKEPGFKSEPTKDGGVVYTAADKIWTYSINKDGEWVIPEERIDFAKPLDFRIYQNKNNSGWNDKLVVAQDSRLELGENKKILHYLIQDLDFVEPGKSLAKGEPSEVSHKLGYLLDNTSDIISNEKGVLTAKNALMPAIMGTDAEGKFNFDSISLAEGLNYRYNSNGKVSYGNLDLEIGKNQVINVTNGKLIVPAGTYKGTETRGDLFIKGEYAIDNIGEINAISQQFFEGEKEISFVTGEGSFAIDSLGTIWDLKIGKSIKEISKDSVELVSVLKVKFEKNISDRRQLAKQIGFAGDINDDKAFKQALDKFNSQIISDRRQLAKQIGFAGDINDDQAFKQALDKYNYRVLIAQQQIGQTELIYTQGKFALYRDSSGELIWTKGEEIATNVPTELTNKAMELASAKKPLLAHSNREIPGKIVASLLDATNESMRIRQQSQEIQMAAIADLSDTAFDALRFAGGKTLENVGKLGIPTLERYPSGMFKGIKFSDTYNYSNLFGVVLKLVSKDSNSNKTSSEPTIRALDQGPLINRGVTIQEMARNSSPMLIGTIENLPASLNKRFEAALNVAVGLTLRDSESFERGIRVLQHKEGVPLDFDGRYKYYNPYNGAIYDPGDPLTTSDKIWGIVKTAITPVAVLACIANPAQAAIYGTGSALIGAGLETARINGTRSSVGEQQSIQKAFRWTERINLEARDRDLEKLTPQERNIVLRYEMGKSLSGRMAGDFITGAALGLPLTKLVPLLKNAPFLNPANSTILNLLAKTGAPGASTALKLATKYPLTVGTAITTVEGAGGGAGIYSAYSLATGNRITASGLTKSMLAGAVIADGIYLMPKVLAGNKQFAEWLTVKAGTSSSLAGNLVRYIADKPLAWKMVMGGIQGGLAGGEFGFGLGGLSGFIQYRQSVPEQSRTMSGYLKSIGWSGVKVGATGALAGFMVGSAGGLARGSADKYLTNVRKESFINLLKPSEKLMYNPAYSRLAFLGISALSFGTHEVGRDLVQRTVGWITAPVHFGLEKLGGSTAYLHGKVWGKIDKLFGLDTYSDRQAEAIGYAMFWGKKADGKVIANLVGADNVSSIMQLSKLRPTEEQGCGLVPTLLELAAQSYDNGDKLSGLGTLLLAAGIEVPSTYFTMLTLGKATQATGMAFGVIPRIGQPLQAIFEAGNQYFVVMPYYFNLAQEAAGLIHEYNQNGKVNTLSAMRFTLDAGSLLASSALLGMTHEQEKMLKENKEAAVWSTDVFERGWSSLGQEARRLTTIGGAGAISEALGYGAGLPIFGGLATATYIQLGTNETTAKIYAAKKSMESGNSKVQQAAESILLDGKVKLNSDGKFSAEISKLGWLLGVSTPAESINGIKADEFSAKKSAQDLARRGKIEDGHLTSLIQGENVEAAGSELEAKHLTTWAANELAKRMVDRSDPNVKWIMLTSADNKELYVGSDIVNTKELQQAVTREVASKNKGSLGVFDLLSLSSGGDASIAIRNTNLTMNLKGEYLKDWATNELAKKFVTEGNVKFVLEQDGEDYLTPDLRRAVAYQVAWESRDVNDSLTKQAFQALGYLSQDTTKTREIMEKVESEQAKLEQAEKGPGISNEELLSQRKAVWDATEEYINFGNGSSKELTGFLMQKVLLAQLTNDKDGLANARAQLDYVTKEIERAYDAAPEELELTSNELIARLKDENQAGDTKVFFELGRLERLVNIHSREKSLSDVKQEYARFEDEARRSDDDTLKAKVDALKARVELEQAQLELAKMPKSEKAFKLKESEVDAKFRKAIETNNEHEFQEQKLEAKGDQIVINGLDLIKQMKNMKQTGASVEKPLTYQKLLNDFRILMKNAHKGLDTEKRIENLKAEYRKVTEALEIKERQLKSINDGISGQAVTELIDGHRTVLNEDIKKLKDRQARIEEELNKEGEWDALEAVREQANQDSQIREDLSRAEEERHKAKLKESQIEQGVEKLNDVGIDADREIRKALVEVEKAETKLLQARNEYRKNFIEIQEGHMKVLEAKIAEARKGKEANKLIEDYIQADANLREASRQQKLNDSTVVRGTGTKDKTYHIEINDEGFKKLDAVERIETKFFVEQLNKVIEETESAKDFSLYNVQVKLAKDMLLSKNSAFEAGTGAGKTDVLIPLVSDAAKRIYGEKYAKRMVVFDSVTNSENAYKLLKSTFDKLGNKVELIKEEDIHNPETLKRIKQADTVFVDPSVLCFAYNETRMPDSRNWVAKELFSTLTRRMYALQDEFHIAAIDNTPYITGIGKSPPDAKYSEIGQKVWQILEEKYGKDWINNESLFSKNPVSGERRFEKNVQAWVVEEMLKQYVAEKGFDELDITIMEENGKFITPDEIQTRIDRVEKDQKDRLKNRDKKAEEKNLNDKNSEFSIAGSEEWVEKAREFAKDWDFVVDAMHKSALVTGWNSGAGNQYAVVEGKTVPVHNGQPAPNMHFSDAAIRVALELLRGAKEKDYAPDFNNLEISPESMQSTWNRVLTEIKEQGGNVIGMTATLRGVEGVVNYGFDMKTTLGLDPRLKYFGDFATNSVDRALGIASFKDGIDQISVDGRDIVIVQAAEKLDEAGDVLAPLKGEKFGRYYKMFTEATPGGNKFVLYRPDGAKLRELTVEEAKWLLARGEKEFSDSKEISQEFKDFVGGLKQFEVLAYINKPGSMATDWKMARSVKGYVFLGERTSDIAAYQAMGRFREIVGSKRYPDMEVFLISKELKGEIDVRQLQDKLGQNGLIERQKAQYEVALNGLIQAHTNTLETLYRNARTDAEREAVSKLIIKWQNQSHQDTYLGIDNITPEMVFGGTLEKAKKFFTENLKDAPLSSENRKLVNEITKRISDSKVKVELGKNELTGAEEILMSLKGGVYGAPTIVDALHYVNAKLTRSDLPQYVSKSYRADVSLAKQKIVNAIERVRGSDSKEKGISDAEIENLREVLEKGNSGTLSGSPELIRALIPLLSALPNNNDDDEFNPQQKQRLINNTINALKLIQETITASPGEFNTLLEQHGLSLKKLAINPNAVSWNGLSDSERSVLAIALLNNSAFIYDVKNTAARDIVASTLHPLLSFDELRLRAGRHMIFHILNPEMARNTSLYLDLGRKENASYIKSSRAYWGSWLKEKLSGQVQPKAIYSYDGAGRRQVYSLFRSLKYYPFIDSKGRIDKFTRRFAPENKALQDAVNFALTEWSSGRNSTFLFKGKSEYEDAYARSLTSLDWEDLLKWFLCLEAEGIRTDKIRLSKAINNEKDARATLKQEKKTATGDTKELIQGLLRISKPGVTTWIRGNIWNPILDRTPILKQEKRKEGRKKSLAEKQQEFLLTLTKYEQVLKKHKIEDENDKLKYLALVGITPPVSWQAFIDNLKRVATVSYVDPSKAKPEELYLLLGARKGADEQTEEGHPNREKIEDVAFNKLELNSRMSFGFGEDLQDAELFAAPWFRKKQEEYRTKKADLLKSIRENRTKQVFERNRLLSAQAGQRAKKAESEYSQLLKGENYFEYEIEELLRSLNVDNSRVNIALKNIEANYKLIEDAVLTNLPVNARKLGLKPEEMEEIMLRGGKVRSIRFAAGREMIRHGNAYSESEKLGGGKFGLKFNFSRLVENPYKLNEIVHYFDIPHELLHIGLDKFYKTYKGKKIDSELQARLEKSFGKGVLKLLLAEDDTLREDIDLRHAGNGSYNELFATIGGLRAVIGNGALIGTKKHAINNLTHKDFGPEETHKKDFQQLESIIGKARSELKADGKTNEALRMMEAIKLKSAFSSANQQLGQAQEAQVSGFMEMELKELQGFIKDYGSRRLRKYVSNLIGQIRDAGNNPIENLLEHIAKNEPDIDESQLPLILFSSLQKIVEAIEASGYYENNSHKTQESLDKMKVLLSQAAGSISIEQLEELSPQVKLKKSEYGVAAELFGNIAPYVLGKLAGRALPENKKENKILTKLLGELESNPKVFEFFKTHYEKIGWDEESIQAISSQDLSGANDIEDAAFESDPVIQEIIEQADNLLPIPEKPHKIKNLIQGFYKAKTVTEIRVKKIAAQHYLNNGRRAKGLTEEEKALINNAINQHAERAALMLAERGLGLLKLAKDIAGIKEASRITEKAFEGLVNAIFSDISNSKRQVISKDELIKIILAQLRANGSEFVKFTAGHEIAILTSEDIEDIIYKVNAGASRVSVEDKEYTDGRPDVDLSGDILVVDFGAKKGKYNSDMTRVIWVGPIPEPGSAKYELYQKYQGLYRVALKAHNQAIKFIDESIKAGNRVGYADVQRIISKAIEESGSEYAGLYLRNYNWGHITGLKGHEGSFSEIKPGMVITVEPIIAGIRTESTILITEQGVELLTGKPNQEISQRTVSVEQEAETTSIEQIIARPAKVEAASVEEAVSFIAQGLIKGREEALRKEIGGGFETREFEKIVQELDGFAVKQPQVVAPKAEAQATEPIQEPGVQAAQPKISEIAGLIARGSRGGEELETTINELKELLNRYPDNQNLKDSLEILEESRIREAEKLERIAQRLDAERNAQQPEDDKGELESAETEAAAQEIGAEAPQVDAEPQAAKEPITKITSRDALGIVEEFEVGKTVYEIDVSGDVERGVIKNIRMYDFDPLPFFDVQFTGRTVGGVRPNELYTELIVAQEVSNKIKGLGKELAFNSRVYLNGFSFHVKLYAEGLTLWSSLSKKLPPVLKTEAGNGGFKLPGFEDITVRFVNGEKNQWEISLGEHKVTLVEPASSPMGPENTMVMVSRNPKVRLVIDPQTGKQRREVAKDSLLEQSYYVLPQVWAEPIRTLYINAAIARLNRNPEEAAALFNAAEEMAKQSIASQKEKETLAIVGLLNRAKELERSGNIRVAEILRQEANKAFSALLERGVAVIDISQESGIRVIRQKSGSPITKGAPFERSSQPSNNRNSQPMVPPVKNPVNNRVLPISVGTGSIGGKGISASPIGFGAIVGSLASTGSSGIVDLSYVMASKGGNQRMARGPTISLTAAILAIASRLGEISARTNEILSNLIGKLSRFSGNNAEGWGNASGARSAGTNKAQGAQGVNGANAGSGNGTGGSKAVTGKKQGLGNLTIKIDSVREWFNRLLQTLSKINGARSPPQGQTFGALVFAFSAPISANSPAVKDSPSQSTQLTQKSQTIYYRANQPHILLTVAGLGIAALLYMEALQEPLLQGLTLLVRASITTKLTALTANYVVIGGALMALLQGMTPINTPITTFIDLLANKLLTQARQTEGGASCAKTSRNWTSPTSSWLQPKALFLDVLKRTATLITSLLNTMVSVLNRANSGLMLTLMPLPSSVNAQISLTAASPLTTQTGSSYPNGEGESSSFLAYKGSLSILTRLYQGALFAIAGVLLSTQVNCATVSKNEEMRNAATQTESVNITSQPEIPQEEAGLGLADRAENIGEPAPQVATKDEAGQTAVTVEPGDTIWGISGNRWPEVYDINPAIQNRKGERIHRDENGRIVISGSREETPDYDVVILWDRDVLKLPEGVEAQRKEMPGALSIEPAREEEVVEEAPEAIMEGEGMKAALQEAQPAATAEEPKVTAPEAAPKEETPPAVKPQPVPPAQEPDDLSSSKLHNFVVNHNIATGLIISILALLGIYVLDRLLKRNKGNNDDKGGTGTQQKPVAPVVEKPVAKEEPVAEKKEEILGDGGIGVPQANSKTPEDGRETEEEKLAREKRVAWCNQHEENWQAFGNKGKIPGITRYGSGDGWFKFKVGTGWKIIKLTTVRIAIKDILNTLTVEALNDYLKRLVENNVNVYVKVPGIGVLPEDILVIEGSQSETEKAESIFRGSSSALQTSQTGWARKIRLLFQRFVMVGFITLYLFGVTSQAFAFGAATEEALSYEHNWAKNFNIKVGKFSSRDDAMMFFARFTAKFERCANRDYRVFVLDVKDGIGRISYEVRIAGPWDNEWDKKQEADLALEMLKKTRDPKTQEIVVPLDSVVVGPQKVESQPAPAKKAPPAPAQEKKATPANNKVKATKEDTKKKDKTATVKTYDVVAISLPNSDDGKIHENVGNIEKHLEKLGYKTYHAGFKKDGKLYTRLMVSLDYPEKEAREEAMAIGSYLKAFWRDKGDIQEPFITEVNTALPKVEKKEKSKEKASKPQAAIDVIDVADNVSAILSEYDKAIDDPASFALAIRALRLAESKGVQFERDEEGNIIGTLVTIDLGIGCMQVTEKTALAQLDILMESDARIGLIIQKILGGNKVNIQKVYDSEEYNIGCGSGYLYYCLKEAQNAGLVPAKISKFSKGDWHIIIAMYNAGPGQVKKWVAKKGKDWVKIDNGITPKHRERYEFYRIKLASGKEKILIYEAAGSPLMIAFDGSLGAVVAMNGREEKLPENSSSASPVRKQEAVAPSIAVTILHRVPALVSKLGALVAASSSVYKYVNPISFGTIERAVSSSILRRGPPAAGSSLTKIPASTHNNPVTTFINQAQGTFVFASSAVSPMIAAFSDMLRSRGSTIEGLNAVSGSHIDNADIGGLQWFLFKISDAKYLELFIQNNEIPAYGIATLVQRNLILRFQSFEKNSGQADFWAGIYRQRVNRLLSFFALNGIKPALIGISPDQIVSEDQLTKRIRAYFNARLNEKREYKISKAALAVIEKFRAGKELASQELEMAAFSDFTGFYSFGPAASFYVNKLGCAFMPTTQGKFAWSNAEAAIRDRLQKGERLSEIEIIKLFSGRGLVYKASSAIISINPQASSVAGTLAAKVVYKGVREHATLLQGPTLADLGALITTISKYLFAASLLISVTFSFVNAFAQNYYNINTGERIEQEQMNTFYENTMVLREISSEGLISTNSLQSDQCVGVVIFDPVNGKIAMAHFSPWRQDDTWRSEEEINTNVRNFITILKANGLDSNTLILNAFYTNIYSDKQQFRDALLPILKRYFRDVDEYSYSKEWVDIDITRTNIPLLKSKIMVSAYEGATWESLLWDVARYKLLSDGSLKQAFQIKPFIKIAFLLGVPLITLLLAEKLSRKRKSSHKSKYYIDRLGSSPLDKEDIVRLKNIVRSVGTEENIPALCLGYSIILREALTMIGVGAWLMELREEGERSHYFVAAADFGEFDPLDDIYRAERWDDAKYSHRKVSEQEYAILMQGVDVAVGGINSIVVKVLRKFEETEEISQGYSSLKEAKELGEKLGGILTVLKAHARILGGISTIGASVEEAHKIALTAINEKSTEFLKLIPNPYKDEEVRRSPLFNTLRAIKEYDVINPMDGVRRCSGLLSQHSIVDNKFLNLKSLMDTGIGPVDRIVFLLENIKQVVLAERNGIKYIDLEKSQQKPETVSSALTPEDHSKAIRLLIKPVRDLAKQEEILRTIEGSDIQQVKSFLIGLGVTEQLIGNVLGEYEFMRLNVFPIDSFKLGIKVRGLIDVEQKKVYLFQTDAELKDSGKQFEFQALLANRIAAIALGTNSEESNQIQSLYNKQYTLYKHTKKDLAEIERRARKIGKIIEGARQKISDSQQLPTVVDLASSACSAEEAEGSKTEKKAYGKGWNKIRLPAFGRAFVYRVDRESEDEIWNCFGRIGDPRAKMRMHSDMARWRELAGKPKNKGLKKIILAAIRDAEMGHKA